MRTQIVRTVLMFVIAIESIAVYLAARVIQMWEGAPQIAL